MRIAVMQPYFLPYLGYWGLLHAVDKFVILDDVAFIKRGWINRNRIALNGQPCWLTLPVQKASQNKLICEMEITPDTAWRDPMLTKLHHAYSKSPFYDRGSRLFSSLLYNATGNMREFVVGTIDRIAQELAITTEIIPSSRIFDKKGLHGQHRIIDICHSLGATEYLNLPGGESLYAKAEFHRNGIDLLFLETNSKVFDLVSGVINDPSLSILDTLMHNSLGRISDVISEYTWRT